MEGIISFHTLKFKDKHINDCIMKAKFMAKLSIMVPCDSSIECYLSQHPHIYCIVEETSASVVFSYGGVIPPLAKILQLLALFDPQQYTISKSMTGISFIVLPSE